MRLKLKLIWDILRSKGDPQLVYFASAIKGGNTKKQVIKELITHIKMTCNKAVLSEHIIEADHREALAKNAGVQLNDQGNLDNQVIEKIDMSWVRQAGFLIAEISDASTGTGRKIAEARWLGTPILCLYHTESSPSAMITGMVEKSGERKYPNVWVAEYMSTREAQITITAFLTGRLK